MSKYFGDKEVMSLTMDTLNPDRAVVSFKDGTSETMDVKEFEAGATDEAITEPAKMQENFVKRTSPMREAMHDVFRRFNPRVNDIPKILTWVHDAIKQGYCAAVDAVFDTKSFDTEGTIEQVCKRLEDAGVNVTEGMNDAQKACLAAIRSNGVTTFEIVHGILFTTLTQKINELTDRALSVALGGTNETRRCEDLEKYRDKSKDYVADKPQQEQVGDDVHVEHGTDTAEAICAGESEVTQGVQGEDTKTGGGESV